MGRETTGESYEHDHHTAHVQRTALLGLHTCIRMASGNEGCIMSVTFSIANSPEHIVTHTWGEDGDGETDTYKDDVLPTCNFSNGNAAHILSLLGVDTTELIGVFEEHQCEYHMLQLRRLIHEHRCDIDDTRRLFALHTVLHAAIQFGQPVHYA